MKEIKKLQGKGLYDRERDDPFELFVSSTKVRWCYYKETARVLGSTVGMAVLQDFEAITPNILCRTMETVEGGGVIVLLLRTMTSLKQLYALSMDVHARFRTEAHANVVPRFNERFLLSLAACSACLVVDDELNVLPISRGARNITPLPGGVASAGAAALEGTAADADALSPAARELADLKASLTGTEIVGSLVGACRTTDQARACLTFAEAIAAKTLRATVALTAGRGRGKSAALGLAIAAAVGFGYANIFVTSPSPENLSTLFEFVAKGLDLLSYKEHSDYEAVASTDAEWEGAIVRVNVFRGHRQTVQYLSPADADKLGSCELLVVDEAAAIPLPVVKRLLGPYLVFLASTVNGYEGTGRSLSLKLVQQLRQGADAAAVGAGAGSSARTFREVSLSEPIRYARGDPVEAWLNELLCLDATSAPKLGGKLPALGACELFAVDRDALFSYHRVSEGFLHRMMSLYVSSHYKNSPNDLQLLSDAPAHRLFALLGPQDELAARQAAADAAAAAAGAPPPAPLLPDVLVVIQICLEGGVSSEALRAATSRGSRAAGDLIPWTLAGQFQDDTFASLDGARIVRIATHPDATKMGYGTRALELLAALYDGRAGAVEGGAGLEVDVGCSNAAGEGASASAADGGLAVEKLRPRATLPPLLVPLADLRAPPRLAWIGASFGVTLALFNFWAKASYSPVYLRQTTNETTSENTMIVLRELRGGAGSGTGGAGARGHVPRAGWSSAFVADFSRRFASLLAGADFRSMDLTLALSILDAAAAPLGVGLGDDEGGGGAGGGGRAAAVGAGSLRPPPLDATSLPLFFSSHDLARLDAFARGAVDHHLVLDLVPDAARLFFGGRIAVQLPRVQAALLLSVGLQRARVDDAAAALGLAPNQAIALFQKAVKRVAGALSGIVQKELAADIDAGIARGAAALKRGGDGGGGGGGKKARN